MIAAQGGQGRRRCLNLTDYLDRKPRQLSGGQRQRVAIGRAIVREPKAFLFDEPLSNLDAALRVQMRVEIGELHNTLKTTMIYVTHDQVEAMTMANKIVVLDKGSVMQVGSPLELYNKPNGLFVAGFIGSPMMNLIRGEPAAKRSAATIGIRPEHVDVSTSAGEWRAKVRLAEHLGSDTLVHAEAEGIGSLTLRLPGENALAAGQEIFVTPREDRVHRFERRRQADQLTVRPPLPRIRSLARFGDPNLHRARLAIGPEEIGDGGRASHRAKLAARSNRARRRRRERAPSPAPSASSRRRTASARSAVSGAPRGSVSR